MKHYKWFEPRWSLCKADPFTQKWLERKKKSIRRWNMIVLARTSCRLNGTGVRFVPFRCPRQLTGMLNHSGWVYCLALVGLLWTVAHASVNSAEIIKSDPKKNPYFGNHLFCKTRTDYASKPFVQEFATGKNFSFRPCLHGVGDPGLVG